MMYHLNEAVDQDANLDAPSSLLGINDGIGIARFSHNQKALQK